LDSNGRLIGINTAILSQSGDSAGIGFAVPINRIAQVLPELIATGKVLRPQLGWVLVDTTQGPMVRRVLHGGPAEKAGVQPIERPVESAFLRGYMRDFERADLIYSVNGKRVQSREEVEELIAGSTRGQPITFVFRRGGVEGSEWKAVIDPVLQ
jgi:S1-C subfamily serine protease